MRAQPYQSSNVPFLSFPPFLSPVLFFFGATLSISSNVPFLSPVLFFGAACFFGVSFVDD
jgi:hypothetical protein